MVTIFIENKTYNVDAGKNLLETCLGLGFDIPYFCWHSALGSVGSCRVCAVKKFRDENDAKGKIVMSCMEPVIDGLRISINDPEVREFRKAMLELLMTNHPHDCPVCDEGGECHLQDMTLLTGQTYRKYRFKKRTHTNQKLGSFINHEMNRCIQCYRCVRFYCDYAGGKDFNVFSARNHVYFGRHREGTLNNVFSGNLVEICPTGVFTDKTFKKHFLRKWDISAAPSICLYCGLGCNTSPGERGGIIKRIRNRYNEKINGYFICDRGRFGYDFANSPGRIRNVRDFVKSEYIYSLHEQPSKKTTARKLKQIIILAHAIGIGSPRASLEANYALRKLVGEDNFYSGFSHIEQHLIPYAVRIMQETPANLPALRETSKSDAVLVLGEDVTNTAPMLALMLRQTLKNHAKKIIDKYKIYPWDDGAVRNAMNADKGGLYVLTPMPTTLDDVSVCRRLSPVEISKIGYAVAYFIKNDLNSIEGLSLSEEEKKLSGEIASELLNASNPLIVSGTGCLYKTVIEAAALIAESLSVKSRNAGLFLTLPECNSAGAAMMGGKNLYDAIRLAEKGKIDCVYILENDIYRRAKKSLIDDFLNSMEYVIVIDSHENETTKKADIILPAATFADGEATIINNEGRAQRYYKVMPPGDDIKDSWRWLKDMILISENENAKIDAMKWENIDDIINTLCYDFPVFGGIKEIAPEACFRMAGQKIPRRPFRYSGRTAEKAHLNLREEKIAEDIDSPLAFTMEGSRKQAPEPIMPFAWWPGWNSEQSINKLQSEIGGPLRGGHFGKRIYRSDKKNIVEVRPVLPVLLHEKELQILPSYSIFGSDELSSKSTYIKERTHAACLLMNSVDAERLEISDNSAVFLVMNGYFIKIPVKIKKDIIEGTAFYPLGFPGTEFMDLPAVCKILKAY